MQNLKCTLDDFYYLIGVPIKYFDKDWNNILSKGYDENISLQSRTPFCSNG